MNQRTRLKRPPTVRETIDRWEDRTASRIGFRDPARPPFDRRLFLKQFWDDHPGDPRAIGFAAAFETAIDRGSRLRRTFQTRPESHPHTVSPSEARQRGWALPARVHPQLDQGGQSIASSKRLGDPSNQKIPLYGEE
jgi:hypothetical protein